MCFKCFGKDGFIVIIIVFGKEMNIKGVGVVGKGWDSCEKVLEYVLYSFGSKFSGVGCLCGIVLVCIIEGFI